MLAPVATALVMLLSAQAPTYDDAARLARQDRVDEAIAMFEQIVEQHPTDVDARVGLGSALIRAGHWRRALEILRATEPDAGENADLFAALARAYRRSGDDERAFLYYRRARALAPDDPDVVAGYESTTQAYGHWLSVEGFGQRFDSDSRVASGMLTASIRVHPRLHVIGEARVQDNTASTDHAVGGGVDWRVGRATTATIVALGGSGNTSLARTDTAAELRHYAAAFELGASVRAMSFAGSQILALSPIVAWDRSGRWRFDGRYTYSHSSFSASGQSSNDSSAYVRETWRATRRVSVSGTYAYGIESFETLTADRVGSLAASTAAAGVSISAPSFTRVYLTWEHQWRANDTKLDRVTLSAVQSWP